VVKIIKKIQLIPLICLALNAKAESSFPDILKSLTNNQHHVVSPIPMEDELTKATTLNAAQNVLKGLTYVDIYKNTMMNAPLSQDEILKLIQKRQITFVIVPGLFGEFIQNRAFEEIFARDSSFKKAWKSVGSTAKDASFDLKRNAYQSVELSNLIDAASIDDSNGNPLFKLIILKTPFGSLESIGSNVRTAEIFNRRLQNYYNLTSKAGENQNFVMLGYSRGTPLALEMVVQAKKNKLSYLNSVNALTSYAGVVSGSSLTDEAAKPDTKSGKLLLAIKELRDSLQYSYNPLNQMAAATNNTNAVLKFLLALGLNSDADPKDLVDSSYAGDSSVVAKLVADITSKLGLEVTNVNDFDGHVLRTKKMLDAIILSVEGLKTESMLMWWKNNELPKKIQYLSLVAAMVDPDKGGLEKEIYESKIGYNDGLDDKSLLKNKKTYETVTGVALNDSQVAIYQSVFLPRVIESLNPLNTGLNTKMLGLLETHHWGVSLQVVNRMKDGRINPYPREQVLWALAAYLNQGLVVEKVVEQSSDK
jgi:hypothetical protein